MVNVAVVDVKDELEKRKVKKVRENLEKLVETENNRNLSFCFLLHFLQLCKKSGYKF